MTQENFIRLKQEYCKIINCDLKNSVNGIWVAYSDRTVKFLYRNKNITDLNLNTDPNQYIFEHYFDSVIIFFGEVYMLGDYKSIDDEDLRYCNPTNPSFIHGGLDIKYIYNGIGILAYDFPEEMFYRGFFIGTFNMGKKDGFGIEVISDDTIYVGLYKNDLKNGLGKFIIGKYEHTVLMENDEFLLYVHENPSTLSDFYYDCMKYYHSKLSIVDTSKPSKENGFSSLLMSDS